MDSHCMWSRCRAKFDDLVREAVTVLAKNAQVLNRDTDGRMLVQSRLAQRLAGGFDLCITHAL